MVGLLATVKGLLRGRDYDIELLLARSRVLSDTREIVLSSTNNTTLSLSKQMRCDKVGDILTPLLFWIFMIKEGLTLKYYNNILFDILICKM